jgi:hypothetical protein
VSYNDGDKDENMAPEAVREPIPKQPKGSVPSRAKAATAAAASESRDGSAGAVGRPAQKHRKVVASSPTSTNDNSPNDNNATGIVETAGPIRIEANFHGRGHWFTGLLVREKANGVVDIQYDDGDLEMDIPADRVRRLPGPGEGLPLEVGTRVESKFGNGTQYFPGIVIRSKTDATTGLHYVDIAYDDGDLERAIPVERVRVLLPEDELTLQQHDQPLSLQQHHSHQHHSSHNNNHSNSNSSKHNKKGNTLVGSPEAMGSRFVDSGPRTSSGAGDSDEEIATALLVCGALVEVLDDSDHEKKSERRWQTGRIVDERQGLVDVRLASGEQRKNVSLQHVRLPRSPTAKKTVSHLPASVQMDMYNLEALRALLRSKDEEIARLNAMLQAPPLFGVKASGAATVPATAFDPAYGAGGSTTFGNGNRYVSQEMDALRKSNEELKQSLLFLSDRLSVVVEDMSLVKSKNLQLAKAVKAHDEEMRNLRVMLGSQQSSSK